MTARLFTIIVGALALGAIACGGSWSLTKGELTPADVVRILKIDATPILLQVPEADYVARVWVEQFTSGGDEVVIKSLATIPDLKGPEIRFLVQIPRFEGKGRIVLGSADIGFQINMPEKLHQLGREHGVKSATPIPEEPIEPGAPFSLHEFAIGAADSEVETGVDGRVRSNGSFWRDIRASVVPVEDEAERDRIVGQSPVWRDGEVVFE